MVKKRSGSSVPGARRVRNATRTRDLDIDFSDIPELTSDQLKKARRVGRPSSGNRKQLIAVRLAPELIAQLKKLASIQGKPYQTLMHELLETAVKKKVA